MSYITSVKQKIIEKENLINLQQEIWTDIADFENYEVSNYGKIRNKLNYKILKQTLNAYGYYTVMLRKNDKQYCQKVHRIIALHFIPNPQQLKCVDHANSEKKDNSISNLRWASNQQNSMNMKKKKNTSSQFKGVSYYQNTGKWQATIRLNGKLQHLGYFNNQEEAGRCYDRKAIELFQEFVKTNFPLEDYQQEEGQEEDQFQTGN